jgi:hypothetical protein
MKPKNLNVVVVTFTTKYGQDVFVHRTDGKNDDCNRLLVAILLREDFEDFYGEYPSAAYEFLVRAIDKDYQAALLAWSEVQYNKSISGVPLVVQNDVSDALYARLLDDAKEEAG